MTGQDKTASPVLWPEWLTTEYSVIHTAIVNEIVSALDHCYASADADGSNWTFDGWVSCSASNIIGMLKRNGNPPPDVGKPQLKRSTIDVDREWMSPGDDDDPCDEQTPCRTCRGSGLDNTDSPVSP